MVPKDFPDTHSGLIAAEACSLAGNELAAPSHYANAAELLGYKASIDGNTVHIRHS